MGLLTNAVRDSPLLQASVGLHAASAIGMAVLPGAWPWLIGGLAANHAAISLAGTLPRTRLLGPNVSRLQPEFENCVALTFDDGPDPEITPRVLDVLDQHQAKATFFVIGDRVARHSSLAREIGARGHTLANHTQSHPHRFAFLGRKAQRREVVDAQRTIEDVTGQRPKWFRAPAGIRNPILQPLLAESRLMLVSWSVRGFDAVDDDADRVLSRLEPELRSRAIVVFHDGTTTGRTRTRCPELAQSVLCTMADRGLRGVALPS